MNSSNLEQRLMQLEELFTHQQQLVQQLNDVTIELRTDVDQLTHQLRAQRKQVEWLQQNNSGIDDGPERPPHY